MDWESGVLTLGGSFLPASVSPFEIHQIGLDDL